jgi:hypothetical protein
MFTMRELADLVREIDDETFAAQMGPFALVQRPPPGSRADEAMHNLQTETRVQPAIRLRGAPSSVDFGDLIVATLPPPLPDGSMQLTIGRSPDCDLVVHDTSVSKHHASVVWDGEEAILSELGSVNGTFINGLKMKDQWTLRDLDALVFGESHFVYLVASTLLGRLQRMAR